MSSTSPSPNSSPTVDLSPSANSPPANSSAPSPARDSPPPSPNPNVSTPPPTNSSSPPPTNSSSPPPTNSTTPPPTNSTTPPPDSPPPSIGVTPPPSNPEPPKPPPSNGTQPPSLPPPSPPPPSSPPPVTPPTPIAPPPTNNSTPAPPPNNPPSTPLPSPPSRPGAPPPSPPPVIPPRPSPPAPPGQSPPAPGLQPPPANLPAPQPSVPGSSPPPPQTNTTLPADPTSPSGPSTPTENPPADATPSSTNTSSGRLPAGGVIAIVLVGMLALSLVVFASWFVHRRKKRRSGSDHGNTSSPFVPSQNSDSMVPWAQNAAIGFTPQSPYHSAQQNGSSSTTNPSSTGDPGGISNSKPFFTYEELVRATNGFSEDNLLGEGGFGCVYKGNLADGREVAVKQLKIGGGQGEREFRAEVEIISRIHHRHLVSIVGYCISDFQRLLVYDYVPNNTLYHHLHGNVPVMTWPTRFKVAAGAARGIAYLHEDCTPRIIHRDIKSSNILLDNNFEAKVADFGLAKLALELEVHTHISTRVMGTFGYMAPEYATTGKLTEKSDVFSFGVVLLELITGRKPVDSSQELGDESLVEWARPLLTQALATESFENLVDPRLQNEYVNIEMFRLTEAAAACVRHSAWKRPKMSQVVRAIDSISEVQDLTNGMRPGDSRIVDSREQSAEIRLFQRMAFGSQEYTTTDFSSSQSSKSGL